MLPSQPVPWRSARNAPPARHRLPASPAPLPSSGRTSSGCRGCPAGRPCARANGYCRGCLGSLPPQQQASALSHENQDIPIYNNSWGPRDDGRRLESPDPLALSAIQTSITSGRGGLGNIYVWAGGNGRQQKDNVNYDGYANSRYTIAVGAIDHNGVQSSYSEPGAPLLISAYSSSNNGPGTTTTDVLGTNGYNGIDGNLDYTNDFGGTSSAAPLVSGVIALMLEANPNLTWRDVQHILVNTASHNDSTDTDWVINGAGHLVNHKYGFGAIDATAAVSAAVSWSNVAPESTASGFIRVEKDIPDNSSAGLSSTISMDENLDVEWVEVVFDAEHSSRGDLEITLISPDGTESILAEQRNDTGDNYQNWVFTSARHWGESSLGDWTLKVADKNGGEIGNWDSWRLNIFGTESTEPVPVVSVTVPDAQASEDGDLGWFTLSRTGDTSVTLDVAYAVSGVAENGIDYEQLSGTATILPGATSTIVTVNPVDDAIAEGNELVTLTLETGTGYQLGTDVNGTVTITDNDLPDLFGSYFNVINEPLDTGDLFTTEFVISNSQANQSGTFEVDFYLSDNSTISTSDFYLGRYTVTNVVGNSSTGTLTKSLRLPSREDNFWDGNANGTTFYIGMIVDADDDVDEANEANNRNNGFIDDYDDTSINKIVIGSYSYSIKTNDTEAKINSFSQQIEERWDQGYELVNVSYGDGRWFGVFGQEARPNAYSYSIKTNDTEAKINSFTQQIEERWDQGYELTDVEYGDGRWFGVFGQTDRPNAYSYSIKTNDTEAKINSFTQQIEERWDQGYELIDVEYGDGRWFGVFGQAVGPNAYSYSIKTSDTESKIDDFTQQIESRWNQGYELIDVAYGDGRWFGVFQD
ncbi:MAG: S8 family serine peptidase [Leptolyngbya sp. SIO1D8]|nr:S8 family serine peptidase [Leptolyngbya sp. SIO1D8]